MLTCIGSWEVMDFLLLLEWLTFYLKAEFLQSTGFTKGENDLSWIAKELDSRVPFGYQCKKKIKWFVDS